ncbi:YbaK/EbsC family protein [Aestuariibacter sp. AA17]|uniref:YbaK/EbsC family protein n=1 Tax=Fluctibacter corallii TaxID=2984329 RepID=A0ABT3A513_9ALTE|nr:YbaK/EbsC family protein [Aestuariibacter sp. AA17]MCV2883682.1 YbaK/EbsC family protein [Aestuariibacter sp. AA17]
MTQTLKPSAQRVQQFLTEHGYTFAVHQMPASTRTAEEAAQAIGCKVAQIAKSLVFKEASTKQAVLIIASGANTVCVEKVKAATGIILEKADAAFVREHVGYAIGGVPPVAHTHTLTTYLDEDIQHYPEIWAAAGTPHSVFRLTPEQLSELTKGDWIALAKAS